MLSESLAGTQPSGRGVRHRSVLSTLNLAQVGEVQEANNTRHALRCHRWVPKPSPLGGDARQGVEEPFCVEFSAVMEAAAHGWL